MFKQLLILSCATLLLCGLAITGTAQTITGVGVTNSSGADPGSGGYCVGQSIRVTFTKNNFPANAVFTAQLSNAAGIFSSPTTLGTGSGSPINANLPAGAGAGTGYKVRVISSAVFGDSPAFKINEKPTVTSSVVGVLEKCKGETIPAITFSASSGASFSWSSTANVGFGTSGNMNTIPGAASNDGTTNLEATVTVTPSINGCTGDAIQFKVRVKPGPTVDNVTSINDICIGSNIPTIDFKGPVAGTAFNWTSNVNVGFGTSGTGDIASVVSTNAATATVNVTPTANGCTGTNKTFTVTVNPRAVNFPAGNTATSVSLCQGLPSSPLSATPTSGNTIRWYASNNSTVLGGAPTPNTNVLATTVNNYYVTQTTSNNCEAANRVQVTVTVNYTPPPNTSNPNGECQNKPAASLGNYASATGGNTLLWYGTAITGGSGSTTPPTPGTSVTGSTTYYLTQKNTATGCESNPRSGLSVQVFAVPGKPSVTKTIDICLNSGGRQLSASASGGASLLWWGTSGSGGSSSTTAPTHTPGSVGTTTYYVSQTANGCEGDRESINVVVHAVPTEKPSTSTTILYCKGATAVNLSAGVTAGSSNTVGSSRVDLQACKLEYSIVSPK